MKKISRIKGGLYGLLIGDALGVPYEFHAAEEIPPRALIEMSPPAGFDRAHRRIKPGTWSDDGALALCLLESLLEKASLDLTDLAHRFVRWSDDGHLAVDQIVFDIGNQTRQALDNVAKGKAPAQCGPAAPENNGNGSLMRVLPLALWHQGDDADLVKMAHTQSLVTHGHARSQVCCALYVLVARALLTGAAMDDAWDDAEAKLVALYGGSGTSALTLDFVLSEKNRTPKGSGYVVDSLWSSRHACRETSYEDIVKAAIALGDDTDTTACIAGGLAGIHFGFEAIPLKWTDALRGRDIVKPLEQQLLRRG
jgi:ADP-ribosyl-[dinitrogen reductase] hydrolase